MSRISNIPMDQLRKKAAKLDVFSFTDYRAFLRSLMASHKALGITQDDVATLLGLSSVDYLRHVLKGRRNLSAKAASNLCDRLKISGKRKKYFISLTRREATKSHQAKNEAFDSLLRLSNSRFVTQIDSRFADFYSSWLNLVLREAVALGGITENHAATAARFTVGVTPNQVEKSLKLLTELNLITFDRKLGEYATVFRDIDHRRGINDLTYIHCHREMIELSVKALFDLSEDSRDINAATLRVDEETFKTIIALYRRVNRIVMKLETRCAKPDRLIQVNTQIFKLNQNGGSEDE